MSKSYRLKCRNPKCNQEFLRYWPKLEFERLQYGAIPGISCFQCGFPKMIVVKSNMTAKDGFNPGFQRNIRKHCATYSEYKAHLKIMGLQEVGYEDLPEEEGFSRTQYFNDKRLKKIYDLLDKEDKFSDREAEYLKNLHKDDKHLKATAESMVHEGSRTFSAMDDKERSEVKEAGQDLLQNIS